MALRNVVHRRNHKERSQPAQRRKLGLLEKHKDYVERARDHHVKQDRLKRLQQKAALRNPDEFNFGMISGASGGDPLHKRRHIERRTSTADAQPLANDLVAILKSQDVGYIRNAVRAEEKKVVQLKQQILPALAMLPTRWLDDKPGRREILQQHGLVDAKANSRTGEQSIGLAGKKTVWVDSIEEAKMFDVSTGQGKGKGKASNAEDLDNYVYSLDVDDFASDTSDDDKVIEKGNTSGSTVSSEKMIGRLVSELSSRQERLNALREAASKLDVVRQLMTTRGTSARKVSIGAGSKNETKLRDSMAHGARVTRNGLALPGPDDGDSDEEAASSSAKSKRSVWKWGRERKR